MGRPPYEPNESDRKKLVQMRITGATAENIGDALGICKSILYRHYKKELDTAKLQAVANVGGALYTKAMNGDTTCMIFYLKTQGRWRETDQLAEASDEAPSIQFVFQPQPEIKKK